MEIFHSDAFLRGWQSASKIFKASCSSAAISVALFGQASAEGADPARLARVVNGPCGFKLFGNFAMKKPLEDGSVLLTRLKTSEDPGPRAAADNRVFTRALLLGPGEMEDIQIKAHASELLETEVLELDRLCGAPDGALASAKKKFDEYRMRNVMAQLAKTHSDLAKFSSAFPPLKPPVLSDEEQVALDRLNDSVLAQTALKKITAKVPGNIRQEISVLNAQRGYDIPFGEAARRPIPVN